MGGDRQRQLYGLGNLLLVLWIAGGVTLLGAVAVAQLGGLSAFFAILAAVSAVLSGVVTRTLCHWLANMQVYVEGVHSNLYQLTEHLLARQAPQDGPRRPPAA